MLRCILGKSSPAEQLCTVHDANSDPPFANSLSQTRRYSLADRHRRSENKQTYTFKNWIN